MCHCLANPTIRSAKPLLWGWCAGEVARWIPLRLVLHKLRALVAQNTSDLGTIKGLNLLTRGDPVNQGKNFSGNDSCRLVLHWHKERNQNARLVMFDSECCCNKISFLIQAPIIPISRIEMDGIKTWCILSIVTDNGSLFLQTDRTIRELGNVSIPFVLLPLLS